MLEIIIFFAKFKQIYWKLNKFIAKLNKFIEKSININIIILVFNIVHYLYTIFLRNLFGEA